MKFLLFALSAICGCMIGQFNPAILLSKFIYKKDIRTLGSKNPGFTNFYRQFGFRWAWLVFILDASKTALVDLGFAYFFNKFFNNPTLGFAFTGCFVMIGHCFPLGYQFQGGKGALSALTTIFLIDWRCGLIGIAIIGTILVTLHYMSLASICSVCISTILLIVFGNCSIEAWICCLLFTALMVWRHSANIKRLINGNESKFSFFSSNNANNSNNAK